MRLFSRNICGWIVRINPTKFSVRRYSIETESKVDKFDVWADEKLAGLLAGFDAPIRFAAGYGSGVFKQIGYSDTNKGPTKPPMVDLIFGVSHPEHWHDLNLKQNPDHYSFVSKFGAKSIAYLQQHAGARMYFNPDVTLQGMRIKYGVISMNDLIHDLNNWSNFYVSGRMQKPIKILRGDSRVKLSNDENLTNAMRVTLLTLPEYFTERQLYIAIVGLSYLGDFRMTFGENPKKIENIVNAQMSHLRFLYRPIFEKLAVHFKNIPEGLKNLEIDTDLVFQQDYDVKKRGNLLLSLPKNVRERVLKAWKVEIGENFAIESSNSLGNISLFQNACERANLNVLPSLI
ncbi:Mitochondrial translocator assembly and maintenance protein 41 [Physocladia obscura]|uniref:Phosphatidate cytidylyltransferase, mitochondrial n=1 Tax=Physocladia obscura TaxID=109957 RepID=A0AAD5SW81_9FUNG|nr:Mitochondrial translocator assembly and maintenance protein 41 [Physocladia obscura]